MASVSSEPKSVSSAEASHAVSLPKSVVSPHIITFLGLGEPQNGRLGNQLFQIAYCWALGKLTYRECIFPSDSFQYSTYFNTPIPVMSREALQSRLTNVQAYHEPSNAYHPFPLAELDANRPWNVQGFFQVWKYLLCFRDELRTYLRLRTDLELELRRKWDLVTPLDSGRAFRTLGIHVRRGDFVWSGTLEFLAQPYYRLALETFMKRLSNKQEQQGQEDKRPIRVVVASDDLGWCKQELSPLVAQVLGDRLVQVQYAENQSDILDLYTLSYCDDLIASNSSFSWMSAFLIGSPETAIVVSPKMHNNGSPDLVMPTWVQIDTKSLIK